MPSSAEALTGTVGDAVAWRAGDDGACVDVSSPRVPDTALSRYRTVGRLAALALANQHVLGLPFASYFLAAVLGAPPAGLRELQARATMA